MFDKYSEDQKIIYETLKNSLLNNKLSHAYLFDTSNYSDGTEFIMEFVKCILCKDRINDSNHSCPLCQAIESFNYPDIEYINPEGMWIKKEQLDNLQIKFSTKSIYNNYKIYIINGAEYLNSSSANSILKFLEEPSQNIIAILITKNINNVLPTIKSRCINFTFKSKTINTIDETEKLLNYIFMTKEEKAEFSLQNNIIDYVNQAIKFIKYIEKNKISAIIYTYNLWFNLFTDRPKNMIGYELLILLYKDIINIKINRNLEFFSEYKNELKDIAENNTIDQLYKKINIILDHRERNKININLNLNMDNMILELGGVL